MELDVGTGRTYLTMTLAFAHALAIPGSYEVVLYNDITENATLNANINSITSDTGTRVWNSSGGNITFTIQSGLTQRCSIFGIIITKTSGLDNTIEWTTFGTGGGLDFVTLDTTKRTELRNVRASGAARDILKISANIAAGALTVDSVLFTGTANCGGGVVFGAAAVTALSCLVKNSIFRDIDDADGYGIKMPSSANKIAQIYNNTGGVNLQCVTECWNNHFLEETDDVLLSGSAAKSHFLNNYFNQQTDDGGWDASNKFTAVTNDELVNASGGDYHLKSTAISIGIGKSIASVTKGYYLADRLPQHQLDIGVAALVRRRVF